MAPQVQTCNWGQEEWDIFEAGYRPDDYNGDPYNWEDWEQYLYKKDEEYKQKFYLRSAVNHALRHSPQVQAALNTYIGHVLACEGDLRAAAIVIHTLLSQVHEMTERVVKMAMQPKLGTYVIVPKEEE